MLAFAAPLFPRSCWHNRCPKRVAGTVVDEQGKPIAGAQVVLYGPPIGTSKATRLKGEPKATATAGSISRPRRSAESTRMASTSGRSRRSFRWRPCSTDRQAAFRSCCENTSREPCGSRDRTASPSPARGRSPADSFSGGTGSADMPGSRPRHWRSRPAGTARRRSLSCEAEIASWPHGSRPKRSANKTPGIRGNDEKAPPGASSLIKLKKTSRLSGRIVDPAGRGVAGQAVESGPVRDRSASQPGRFQERPGANGRRTELFRLPANLLIGSSYRVVVREPGNEPIISDFFPITEESVTISPLELRPLRTVSGLVVDRQGKPVADVEVFQSGDGPSARRCGLIARAASRWEDSRAERCFCLRAARDSGFTVKCSSPAITRSRSS